MPLLGSLTVWLSLRDVVDYLVYFERRSITRRRFYRWLAAPLTFSAPHACVDTIRKTAINVAITLELIGSFLVTQFSREESLFLDLRDPLRNA